MNCPGQIGNSVCTNFSVPLDYSNQNGEKINVFATIFGSGNGGNNLGSVSGIVWALDFGCDGWLLNTAYDWMEPLSNAKNYAIIWPNMRGDGMSTPRLACPDDPQGMHDPPSVACGRAWQGNQSFLQHFSLGNAIQDVRALVQAARPDLPNYLVGIGHGSLWAQRLQAAYPKLFVRTIFAGYANPMAYDFFASLGSREAAVRQVLSECDANPTCSARLGGGANVQSTLSRVLQLAEMDLLPCNRHLGAFAPRHNETWRHVYSGMIAGLVGPASPFLKAANPTQAPVFLLPLLYRLQRCDPNQDVPVLTHLFNAIASNAPTPQPPSTHCTPSPLLRANVLMNELTRNDPNETVRFVQQAITVNADIDYSAAWLSYYNAFPTWRVPSANTGQDPWFPANNGQTTQQAKMAGTLATAISYPTASSSIVYDSTHNTTYVALQNAGSNLLGHGSTCVLNSMQSWFVVNSTLAKLDPCVNQTNPLDLLCNEASSQGARSTYFGNVDPWQYSTPQSGTFVIPDIAFTTIAPPTTTPPNTTTAAPTRNPNATNPSAAPSDSHTGAIVGAIFGVIAVLIIAAVVYFKCIKGSGDAGGGSNFGGGGGGGGYHTAPYQSAPPAAAGAGYNAPGNVQYAANSW